MKPALDDRLIVMSTPGFKQGLNAENGKNFYWTTDITQELPIKIKSYGSGSEPPITVSQQFLNQVKNQGSRDALFLQEDGKTFVWTWDQYSKECYNFAKSLAQLTVKERSSVVIMGFNSP